MSFNLNEVGWVLLMHWLQLSVAGVAIFHAGAQTYREWQTRRARRPAMYGRKATAGHPVPSFGRAA